MNRLARLLLLCVPCVLAGCVERLLVIRSQPTGAEVYIDGEKRGVTPHTEKYAYYGTREVTLAKKGYRTYRQNIVLNAPWWQVFPMDLLTDVALPFTITDRVDLEVPLEKEPAGAGAFQETLKRAEEARAKANAPLEEPK
jgi:hypothetical protein